MQHSGDLAPCLAGVLVGTSYINNSVAGIRHVKAGHDLRRIRFCGRYIARRMAKEGWRVRVAVRRPNEAMFVKPYGVVGQVEPVLCNIRDDASVAARCRVRCGCELRRHFAKKRQEHV